MSAGTRRALLVAVILAASAPLPTPAAAEVRVPAGWDKGFNFTAWWHDAYSGEDAARSLDELAGTGANAVALVVTQYQATRTASRVEADPERTPSDDSLAVAVFQAKARGLKVRLRILVDLYNGGTRLDIDPNRPNAWFASYRRRVVHYAGLARGWGVETLEIGSELQALSGPHHANRWREVAAAARGVFGGRLSYGANWTEYEGISWWDAVDEIGVNAYFPLSLGGTPAEDEVVAAWSTFVDASGQTHHYLQELAGVAARFRRPVVFSEIGYPSSLDALREPWRATSTYSARDQETGLRAAFRALAAEPWFGGLYLWHWYVDPAAGGPGDTDHTVQNKPAQETVREAFTSCGSRNPWPRP
jgi:hypothetical protein